MTGEVTIEIAALHRLLRDVAATAAPTAAQPAIHGVLLHTAAPAPGQQDSTVLVGTTTDRYILGQAHEPITCGTLPATFVDLRAVRVLLAALAPHEPDVDDTDGTPIPARHGTARLIGDRRALTLVTERVVRVDITPQVGEFPPCLPRLDPEAPGTVVQLAPRLLRVLIDIAERRATSIVLTPHAPGHPARVGIGDRYSAIVGTIRPDAIPPQPALFPLTAGLGVSPS